jgi:hypothetical protein
VHVGLTPVVNKDDTVGILGLYSGLDGGSLELPSKRLALSRASSSLLKILMSSSRSQSSLNCFVASKRSSLGNLSIKIGVKC